jgi:tRNA(Ile)-lysidine synthase
MSISFITCLNSAFHTRTSSALHSPYNKAGDHLLNRIAETIERHGMFRNGQTVGVAVSGGADSVCLLHALVELTPRWNLHLHVLHLDHGLRGDESRRDAQFVADLAARLSLPATIRAVDLTQSHGNLEQAGREARLSFFREMLSNQTVDRVALGHTRSDQAETVLFRFLRGAGTAGLAAIRPVTSDGIVRPLLEIDRSEVEDFLRARGIVWREDSTNAGLDFARNRIRHQLLPQLASDWNPAIIETLSRTADWALAEEAYWDSEIDRLATQNLVERDGGILIRAASLTALPLAVARRLVRRAIGLAKGDLRRIDFPHIAQVLELAASPEGDGRLQTTGLDIVRSFDWLRFAKPVALAPDFQAPAPVPGVLSLPAAGLQISLELVERTLSTGYPHSVYNQYEADCLDWCSLSGPLEVRNWRPGDQYQPQGSAGVRKIKTFFQEARIPIWERRNWPILLDGSSIVWARKFGPAADFAARPVSRMLLVVREHYESGLGAAASIE